jgi:hypothetical protein
MCLFLSLHFGSEIFPMISLFHKESKTPTLEGEVMEKNLVFPEKPCTKIENEIFVLCKIEIHHEKTPCKWVIEGFILYFGLPHCRDPLVKVHVIYQMYITIYLIICVYIVIINSCTIF